MLRLFCGASRSVDRAVFIHSAFERNAEIVRADRRQFGLELAGGMEGGAAEHDRHAAADRACRSAAN